MNGRGGGREGDWHVRSPLVSSVKVQKRPSMTPVSGSMVTSKKHGRVGRPGMVDIWRRGGKKATDPCQPHSELCRRRFACRIWFVAGTYRSAEGVEETGADGGANVADVYRPVSAARGEERAVPGHRADPRLVAPHQTHLLALGCVPYLDVSVRRAHADVRPTLGPRDRRYRIVCTEVAKLRRWERGQL